MVNSIIKRYLFLSLFFPIVVAGSILQIQAVRATGPIRLDGNPDEEAWQNAIPVPPLIQDEPNEGAPASQRSDIRVIYDDKAIYVGARLFDSAPDSIIARLGRRDSDENSDFLMLGLDPYHDQRSGYYFGLSAAGTIYDGVIYNDTWTDESWDGVWEGAVQRNQEGWSLEMRIPFSQLRFKKSNNYVWGINFYRQIERKNEEDWIIITPRNQTGLASRFADLVGIENIDAERKVEVLPYFRTKGEYLAVESDDPFNDGSRYFAGAGADFKIGVGNNLTIDGTVNPDFGQVEVDPAVINLSDVETYYDEKRPFFIEGSKIFNFGSGGATNYWNINFSSPSFLYSRRIGRAPQCDLSDYDYTDVPDGTRMIAAGKLTGKVGNNWNIGMLNALTAREFARVSSDSQNSKIEVEPLTNYTILRTQKEFREGRHGLGMLTTSTKSFFKDEDLSDGLSSEALVVGLDGWTFLDTAKTWVISGWSGMSNLNGTQTFITDIQTNSRHYLQRPDARHVEVDSTATSLTGYATRICLNKEKGNVIVNAALGLIGPRFDVNDLGFLSRSDVINMHFGAGYRWTEPTETYRYLNLILAGVYSQDFGGNPTSNGVMNFGYCQFPNYYWIDWGIGWFLKVYDNRLTRGGPLVESPAGSWGYLSCSSDDRKRLVVGSYIEGSRNVVGSYYGYYQVSFKWKPAENLSIELTPSLNSNHDYSQWVTEVDDPSAVATYNKRYVFAKLYQNTLAASIRLDWTFTPRLTLQLYAQPLYGAGDYSDFKELSRPKSYKFLIYEEGSEINTDPDGNYIIDPDGTGPADSFTIDNPDFNVYSIRSSAVLRWEFSPGSALYLVWTHNRYEGSGEADFDLNRSINRVGKIKPDNIFMIKASYWFNV